MLHQNCFSLLLATVLSPRASAGPPFSAAEAVQRHQQNERSQSFRTRRTAAKQKQNWLQRNKVNAPPPSLLTPGKGGVLVLASGPGRAGWTITLKHSTNVPRAWASGETRRLARAHRLWQMRTKTGTLLDCKGIDGTLRVGPGLHLECCSLFSSNSLYLSRTALSQRRW